MRNLLLFIKRFYPFFLFLVLEVAAFILISRSNAYQHNLFVNSSNEVTGSIYKRKTNLYNYFMLRKQNDVLQEENALLRKQLSNVKESTDSIITLDTTQNEVYEFWGADVINHTTQKKYNYFTLNKGNKNGVVKGLGVIDANGIVGTITNVSANYAVGISLINKNAHTSVRHKKSGAIGLMRWQGKNLLTHVIEDITKTAGVEIGDTIVTSGYSTFYPKDLIVGTVTHASIREGSNFYDIEIQLSNDILSLDKVYIVNHYKKQELDSLETSFE